MKNQIIRIGTRGSPLALIQAGIVQSALQQAHRLEAANFEIVPIKTTGDRIKDKPLTEFGGKGLFTKEIEESLLTNDIDIAVHCMKDMATQLPEGLTVSCILPREDPRDVLIAKNAQTLEDIPTGARVGTCSLRRACQVLHHRPDLEIVPLRGNVQTRIDKIESGVAEATLLALAGLKRLGKPDLGAALCVETMLPAIAQGALGIECHQDNTAILDLLSPLNHNPTYLCVQVERAFLRALDGSCKTPIAGLATLEGGLCSFTGLVASPDGEFVHKETIRVGQDDAVKAAQLLGEKLYEKLQKYLK